MHKVFAWLLSLSWSFMREVYVRMRQLQLQIPMQERGRRVLPWERSQFASALPGSMLLLQQQLPLLLLQARLRSLQVQVRQWGISAHDSHCAAKQQQMERSQLFSSLPKSHEIVDSLPRRTYQANRIWKSWRHGLHRRSFNRLNHLLLAHRLAAHLGCEQSYWEDIAGFDSKEQSVQESDHLAQYLQKEQDGVSQSFIFQCQPSQWKRCSLHRYYCSFSSYPLHRWRCYA